MRYGARPPKDQAVALAKLVIAELAGSFSGGNIDSTDEHDEWMEIVPKQPHEMDRTDGVREPVGRSLNVTTSAPALYRKSYMKLDRETYVSQRVFKAKDSLSLFVLVQHLK